MLKVFLFVLSICQLHPTISVPIDNEIIGDLNITCLESSVLVNFKTKNPFNGRVYIRGSYDVPSCNVDFSSSIQDNAVMTLPFNECNSKRERLLSPSPGIMHIATVIVSFHPLFITKADKAYRIECVYKSIDYSVTSDLDVSMLPTLLYNFAPTIPVCSYDLRLGNNSGNEIRFANVGDPVYHHWSCDSEAYAMLVHSCFVSTSGRPTFQLVNSRGCSIDKNIMQNLTYSDSLTEAWVETHAFTYQDVASLRFNCKISLCLKTDANCYEDWTAACNEVRRRPRRFADLDQEVFSDNLIVSEGFFKAPTEKPSIVVPTSGSQRLFCSWSSKVWVIFLLISCF